MLFLLFQIGNDRYALESGGIAEVLPLLTVKQLPLMPRGVAGALNYRGMPVPVVDLSELMLGRPAARRMSTRMILVHYPQRDNASGLLGLIAEKAMETARLRPSDFADPGIRNPATPYLGPVVADTAGLIQWIDPKQLLPDTITEKLFMQIREPTDHFPRG